MNAAAHVLNPATDFIRIRADWARILYIPLTALLWGVCLLCGAGLVALYGLLAISSIRWRLSGRGPSVDELRDGYMKVKDKLDLLRDEADTSLVVRFPIWAAGRLLAVVKGRLDELLMAEAAQYMLNCLDEYEITEDGLALLMNE